jgi:amino acid adenylation domain-containing protein/non-ribosomal peptide synthase protein (TIGR01720 family)
MSQNDVELIYELSPMQEAMLLASLAAPGSGVYVVQLSLRLTGRLDVAAFARAWGLMVERHGVLRTGFYWEELEKPMQVVYRRAGLEIRRESLRGLSAEEQDARVQARLDADRAGGFDLGEPPLVRLALFDLGGENGAESWQLVWSQHHLLMDGWSQSLLLKELFTAYAEVVSGREPAPVRTGRAGSYRDYIAWLQRQDMAAAESFWRQALAGLTAPALLAGGGRTAAPSGFRGSRRRQAHLPAAATAALREVGRRHGLTLNTLVQGAWSLLLAQATGAEEVVFGSTVAGRPAELPGVESIVGLFINTLPVRVSVPPQRGVLEWLRDLQARQVEARRYEHAPLHQVQGWSEVLAGMALFDTLLAFESYPVDGALSGLLPDLTLSAVTTNELTEYPLTLVVIPGVELSLEIVYDGARFEEGAADRLLERLAGLLRGLPGALLSRLEGLPGLPEGERQGLLFEPNDTRSAYPREASVAELFAAVTASTPQASAVVGDGEAWSYGRLDAASSRLARHLAALGVGPGARVGVAMERSADLVVGVLGILKAGAAYVPLDPAYPGERLAFMLADTGADLVLVHGRTRERLAALGARRVCLEADGEAIGARSAAPPALRIPAEALAYVIYTSGSTGRPKGVAVPHRAIVRLVRETNYVHLGPGDRTGQVASISFDAATYEIWGALLNGATVVVIPREVVLAPERFAAALQEQRVTSMFLTASLFTRMAQEAPDAFSGMSELLVGGEAVDPAAARTVLAGRPPRRLLNGYGPTESTTFAAWHWIREVPEGAAGVPIGLPLSNTTLYVLDRRQRAVPAGTPGELCIGGDGLAWGYLNRPELTAERFVPHPWGAGERLYRTGDLVRRLPHRPAGALEFLGRFDDQIKIRGFRIEPGEIEAVLSGHPAVGGNAVVARRDAAGQIHLVAYVAGRGGRAPGSEELRSWLRERLPDFMVPSAFVTLEALPLTAHGKVDRRALPAPDLSDRTDPTDPTEPADPIAELLAGIWADVLGLERVGLHDDFFALGGHSLLATRVASRLRSVLGVEVPVRSVLEEPTVARLAAVAREALRAEGAPAPALAPVPREGDLPLSFAQQRLWFIDQLQPGNPGYNIAAGVRLTGDLSVPRLARSFAEVVRRHEVLRTAFASREGRPVQVIAPQRPTALPVVDLGGLPPASREPTARRLAAAESLWPFDLQRGPLLRLTLVRLGEAEHLLLVTMHHIVADGWSIGVLMREVQALYRGLSLPELPVQYADYAVWQRQWLAGEALERQLAWWRGQLAGTPGVLELPADHPRPAVLSLRGGETRFVLARELSRRLRELGRREGATPYMILAAALLALLSRLSGQKDLTLGSPIAGRTRLETEGLIGFFVNTLVLRADVGRAEVFLDLLRQVREASLGAYAHQDLPFEKLVDEIQPERDLSRSPLVQVALAVNDLVLPEADLEGLVLTPEDAPSQVAKFDLAFILGEDRDGRFAGLLHYATDLYDATTAVRLTGQFTRCLDALTAWPGQPLADLSYLTEEERQQVLVEWNDTAASVRPSGLLHQLFAERAEEQPEATAVVWEEEAWSYAELASRASRLARFLIGLGVGRGTPVGVWMERSHHMPAAVLGILEAGGTYVPLDPAWPAERAETILAALSAPVIVASRATLPAVEAMQWRLPWLGDAVCLDVETPEPETEAFDAAGVRALWDLVAERATDPVSDRITAGGFVSSFTGLPFREDEVDEYRDRVLSLAAPWLTPGSRVLEVGCGAGLILWEMARRVKSCTGIDPSERTQERNRVHAAAAGIGNVDLRTGFAHEIGGLFPEGSFDLIVLASTVQFFPGPRYLERVVSTALRLLAPGGALLVADVPDARREAGFRAALAAAGAPPKQGARELWLDEGLFRDVGGEVLHRTSQTSGFANELGYRYDVLLRKEAAAGPRERRKRLWTGWHAARCPAIRPDPVGSPEDIAYIIHTSGSTGAPKGIAVQHAPAVNLIAWVNRSFGVGPGDRLLFVTSLCFDLSVYDIFGVLAAGGTVHVAPEAALRDPAWQVRLLCEEPVTIWDSAPAALQQLAPLFPAPEDSPLRLVLLSGDWIPVRLPDQVRSAFPRARVVALGGATEATVWSNWYPVGEVDPRWPSIPYGRPIPEARYHVLDAGMQPCPIGVPGDLCIGGRCLCVGYTGQVELTAAQFVPDPFAPAGEPGARLYRTGDRARFRRDGNLELLGRADQQVKVRGYRIEPGEIEVALLRHPRVRAAVVIAREDRPGDRILAAYVVPREGPPPHARELRTFLGERLPPYMVPSAFVTLEALPVTANGKLDRQALPAPQRMLGESGAGDSANPPDGPPADPITELLAGLFAEVLGLDAVGVHDNFFTLGGHSLLATQLMSRVRAALQVEVPLRELFEAPTAAALARVVWAARQGGGTLAPPVTPLPAELRQGGLPVSFGQQRLWSIDQLDPGNPAYNIPFAVRLRGEIDADLLARIFAAVTRRHEALRTTFAVRDGTPVQVIAPASSPSDIAARPAVALTDLSGLPAVAREERALALAVEEARRPFDLRSGPLLRLGLIRLAEREHLLLMTMHHIVSDGWSMGVLLREVGSLHAALSQGLPSPLPELPVQYADFAVWQRGWLQGGVLAAQLDFWRRQLAGAPAALELPTDRPRPAVRTFAGATLPVALPPAASAAVRRLCRERGATPFMTLLAAWALLLGRHAGQDDVCIGTPVAGRNRREIEDLIGFFANMLVMRVDGQDGLPGAPGFGALLARVRAMALDAFAHQDVPFERVAKELVPVRDPAIPPLYQVIFALQNAPGRPLAVPGLVLSPVTVDSGLTKFDLILNLWEDRHSFAGALERNTDLFDAGTAERLPARFAALLEGAAADPGRALSDLPLLLPAELDEVLREHNATAGAWPRDASLPELFAAVAREQPEAPAVVAEDGEVWSYGRLDAASNRLARHLAALAVEPGARVGVALERSAELIAALLAIVKAGAAYVPLDPGYPDERLAFLLADTRAAVVLAHRRTRERLAALPVSRPFLLVCLDRDHAEIAAHGGAPLSHAVPAAALAYVIYTSGSTGRPKGVAVPHRAIVRLALGTDGLTLCTDDRLAWNANTSFDAATFEVWGTLLRGAALVVIAQDLLLAPRELAGYLARRRVTVLHLTTALFNRSVREEPAILSGLRCALFGGEAADPAAVAQALERPPQHLLHMYGPTESTTFATWHEVRAQAPGAAAVPIGRPLAGTTAYLLDRRGSPVPPGVPGELSLGGEGLAWGYLDRPDLTAERFVPDPWSAAPGGRLYRTGDLVRRRADGALEFQRRLDGQVKIRGFRIEPGEVESVLGSRPGVAACAVAARRDGPGDARLVAYVVAAAGSGLTAGALREDLRRALPASMIPAAIVFLESLPLTPGGKLDRRALPAPEQAAPQDAGPEAPAGPREALLAGVWAEVLGRERVGIHDNFFELGGDSILCIQVVSRARAAGLWFSPRDLFQSQTVERLALVARVAGMARTAPDAASEDDDAAGDVPLTPVQRWFFALGLRDLHHYNQALVLAVREPVDPDLLETALAAVAAHHAALRFGYRRESGGEWRQIPGAVAAGAAVPLERVDLSALPGERRAAALEAVAARLQASLDVERGPLLRAALFELGAGGQRLFLVLHHLIVDGVSWRILLEDLGTAYRALAAGSRPVLAPVGTSLRQWGELLASSAQPAAGHGELDSWLALGRREVRPLPVDREEGANSVASARRVMTELDEEETRALLQDVPPVYGTRINDALLTALVQAFAGWTGEPRLLVDLEGHGREDHLFDGADLSRTVGWLTAIHPVLLELAPGAADPGAALKAVREQLRAVPRGGLGFGLPAAQVAFNYLGQLDRGLPEPALFAPAAEPSGPPFSPRQERPWLLEVTGGILGGRLRLTWTYSESFHTEPTLRALDSRFLGALRALIAHCRTAPSRGSGPAGRAGIERVADLSPMQQAMLFHSLYAPGSGVYVVQTSLRLAGRLDLRAFRQAWQRVAERQELLRTGFHWEGLEKPLQAVEQSASLPLHEESWEDLDAAAQAERLAAFLEADREQGFDLSAPPLMRLALFTSGAETHQLVWSQHHLLSDGWSLGLLFRELFTLYAALAEGREPSLPRPGSYLDYIAWLQRQDLAAAERFWRRSLAGFTAPTLLAGGDGRGTAQAGFRDARRRRGLLSAGASDALHETGRRHHLTLSTLVQGAWSIALVQETGEREVVFGTTVAGRPPELPGVESIFGPFINTLPVRVEVDPARRLLPWLAGLQDGQVEARRFEHAPLAQIQAWSELPAGTALFDHLLVFESYPLDKAVAGILPDLRLEEVRTSELTNYPLTLAVSPLAGLLLEMVHDRRRINAAKAARLLERVTGLLREIAADPERRLMDLPWLSEGERQQVLVEVNDTRSGYPREASLLAEVSAVAAAQPAATAVVDAGGETWSYGRLDEAAGRLAAHLLASGAEPGGRVGVAMERSADLILGLLAILKAGAAYVPLDPGYPDERLAFMLADTAAPVVLVHGRTRERLAALGAAGLVCLDRDRAAIDARPAAGRPVRLPAEALAYVIYTSGSTGRPKGVAVQHRAIVRLVRTAGYAPLGSADRVAHVSNTSFDAATFEIWGALLNGAAVVVIPRAVAQSPADLAAVLRRERVTALFLTTALFNQVVREVPDAFAPLRCMLFGGEAVDPGLAARALAQGPERLLHVYGPTESTTFATFHRVTEVAPGAPTVPIPLPLADTAVYVLDRWRQLVPAGAAGELYVGGDGLAWGYWRRPELTAESFVPHPWGAGERLYRTGDLARRRVDGKIEIAGRLDDQVKIRGFRIEPGEVEAVLSGLPGVAACAVLARRDERGDPRLVAYAVPAGGADLAAGALHESLRRALPSYMLPSAIVLLDALPLTPGGKVDRRALPDPAPVRSAAGAGEPAGDPVEELLAGIWAEVLGLDQVGRHDDFFALGGHSLLATKVVSRIRRLLPGVELPLRELFAAPTVAELARSVRTDRGGAPAPPMVPVPRTGDLPLSFAQQRLWLIDQIDPGSPAYNILLAVRLSGEVDRPLLAWIFAELVRRHETLRTTFAARGGQPVQVIAPQGAAPPGLPVVDLADLPEPRRESLARGLAGEESARGFDLRRGPLLRLRLVRLGGRDHLLLMTMHHVIADGWSLGVLVREIGALSAAFAQGRPSPLPELPVQYADFAAWQREWLRGPVLEAQLAFWRAQLGGALQVLALPADRPRPAVRTHRGAQRPLSLSPALSAAVRGLCRRQGATPFMALLAAWAVLLGRHAGQEDVLVGTPVAGRNRWEIEGLIGFFVNMLVLRTDLSGAPSFGELLGRVRGSSIQAFAHQDLPFERLVEELAPMRDLAVPPLVQVTFALQNAPLGELALPGITLSPLAVESRVAQLDLTLSLGEAAGVFAGTLEHDADLFDGGTVERLLARFAALLEGAVADPGRPLPDLPLLLPAELEQVLRRHNATASAYPRDASLPELFAAVARELPDAPAVLAAGEEWSYGRLDAASSRLARHLERLGVRGETAVGIAMERSPELVLGILAILKAGGVYVPLDASYPAERVAFMLADTRAPLVLVHAATRDRLAGQGAPLVAVDGGAWEGEDGSPPDPRAGTVTPAESLACVIYTSGSTGVPKGVALPHRAIVRLVRETDYIRLGPGDRMGHVASVGFDAAAYEIWGALLNGAALVVIPRDAVLSPPDLAAALVEQRITSLLLTTALFTKMAREAPAAFAGLRDLLVGGEAMDAAAARTVLAGQPPRRLLNAYGPAESATIAAWHPLREVPQDATAVPIGRPVANTTLYVLDRWQAPVPAGSPGELAVGGDGLARGYCNRPELTAERFVPHPWAAGERLYRTGDLARHGPDGALVFLGRLDDQIKIRGLRIEPGEVEAVLAGHPEVRECAVVARRDASGEIRLAAYVVGRDGKAPCGEALRAWLRDLLPEPMVPAAFVALPSLPLTANGKVDRKALPLPESSRRERRRETILPRTATERMVAEVWKELLGLGELSVEDDVFALGGHSLLASQVRSRLRQICAVDLPLREVFRHPTVAGLAGLIDARTAPSAEENEVAALLDEIDVLSDDEARSRVADLLFPREEI